MTTEKAKTVLLRHRPGWPATNDPELAQALAYCEQDPEVRAWFDEQRRVQAALRNSFRQITPPAGLKEQILSEHHASLQPAWWRHPRVLAAAAALLFMAAGAVFWLQHSGGASDGPTLSAFRTRMAKEALRLYRMEVETSDLAQIRSFLAQQAYPADFVLPAGLEQATVTGCLTTRWQGANVAMICFLKGKSNPSGVKSDLWLFVMDQSPVKDAPTGIKLERVNRLITATWMRNGKIYLLGTEGDEAELRKWL